MEINRLTFNRVVCLVPSSESHLSRRKRLKLRIQHETTLTDDQKRELTQMMMNYPEGALAVFDANYLTHKNTVLYKPASES